MTDASNLDSILTNQSLESSKELFENILTEEKAVNEASKCFSKTLMTRYRTTSIAEAWFRFKDEYTITEEGLILKLL